MNKKDRIIIGSILGVLITIITVIVIANNGQNAIKAQLNNDAIFKVLENGKEVKSYNMQEIKDMGETTFDANLKTSGNEPIKQTYTGVALNTIVENAGIKVSDSSVAIVSAIDGYSVAVTMDKFKAEDNVYLAYICEGELIGTREEGGKGPYQMVISKDPFSQYWCKYAYSVDIVTK